VVGWLALLLLLPLLLLLLGWRNDAMPATRRAGESSMEAWATPTRSMAGSVWLGPVFVSCVGFPCVGCGL